MKCLKAMAAAAAAGGMVVAAVPAEAKKKPQMTALALQQLQSKDFEADKVTTFAAVMTVLQDEGYRVQSGDRDTGLITAVGSGKKNLTWLPFVGFGTSKKTPVVTAFVEDMGPQVTRVRLNFVMAKVKANQYGTDLGDEEPILDAQVYSDAFEKVAQGIFVRQSMAARAAPSPVPAVATAVDVTAAPAPAANASAGAATPQ